MYHHYHGRQMLPIGHCQLITTRQTAPYHLEIMTLFPGLFLRHLIT